MFFFFEKIIFRNKVFELSSTYQISENIRVTLLLSPILIVHFIIFFCYFIGMIIIQLNIDNISYTDFRTIMIYLYVSLEELEKRQEHITLPGCSLLHIGSAGHPSLGDPARKPPTRLAGSPGARPKQCR